jgi:peptide/nickel transport system substrate-binding protein
MSFLSAGDASDRTTNRRRLLRGLGAAGLAGIAGGEAVVEHLSAFGIEAELVERDTGTCRDTDYGNGKFDVAMQGWADYDHSYPYFHLDRIVRSGDATDI